MLAVCVVVVDVFIHKTFEMPFIENNHMVEQIPATAADPTLGNSVLPGTAETGPLGLDAEALHNLNHLCIELRAAIKDQIAGHGNVRKCLPQLLRYPGTGRMASHVKVQHATAVIRNDEEAVKNAEGQRRHSEEVHRRNRLAMVVPECHPPLCRFGISGSPPHPTQDSALRDIESKHFQFTMNTWRAPGGILGNHVKDEVAQFPAQAFSSRTGPVPREPFPVKLEASSMPANDSLRLHEDQGSLPESFEADRVEFDV